VDGHLTWGRFVIRRCDGPRWRDVARMLIVRSRHRAMHRAWQMEGPCRRCEPDHRGLDGGHHGGFP